MTIFGGIKMGSIDNSRRQYKIFQEYLAQTSWQREKTSHGYMYRNKEFSVEFEPVNLGTPDHIGVWLYWQGNRVAGMGSDALHYQTPPILNFPNGISIML
jgi:hypothetical protein